MKMGFSGLSQAHDIHTSYSNTTLVVEKIKEWEVFQRFLSYNPEIKEKYAVFKTYDILKDATQDC
jgi:hypothetical protein